MEVNARYVWYGCDRNLCRPYVVSPVTGQNRLTSQECECENIHALASAAKNTLSALSDRLMMSDEYSYLVTLAGEARGLASALEICTREEIS